MRMPAARVWNGTVLAGFGAIRVVSLATPGLTVHKEAGPGGIFCREWFA